MRHAILALIPALLVKAFDRNISLGLPRNAPAIISQDGELGTKRRPRFLEREPVGFKQVPALAQALVLPSEEGKILENKNDDQTSLDFLRKKILVGAPHIYII